jgi:hypothetical protein
MTHATQAATYASGKIEKSSGPARPRARATRAVLALTFFLTLLSATAYGTTVTVSQGDNLQQAIDNAQPGDTIILAAGAVFAGPITLPAQSGSAYITIQSSALGSLPAAGQRVGPADAVNMPKITASAGAPALRTEAQASYYKIIGIEFLPDSPTTVVDTVITLGDSSAAQDSVTLVPHHITLDRCYIHGSVSQLVKRGVGLQSGETSILNSYISEIHILDGDSQGIGGWNGPGPFQIINNYVEAASENIMFGGSLPNIPDLVPSDIEIRRNHLYKPLHWRPSDPSYAGITWPVKNLFELKSGRRVVVEGNLMENQWGDVDQGYGAINLTVSGQDSGDHAALQYITIKNNIIRHVGEGVRLSGMSPYNGPNDPCHDLEISNNVFDDVNGSTWTHSGEWMRFPYKFENVKIRHNTVLQSYTTLLFGDGTLANNISDGFEMTDNIVKYAGYGFYGVDYGTGQDAINHYFPDAVFERNVMIGGAGDASLYSGFPENSASFYFPATVSAVCFSDLGAGDYRLDDTCSPYTGAATDGKDIGVDQDELEAAFSPAAAFSLKVNFQPASSAVPSGYVADSGAVYGDRGNGYTYGWDASGAQTRDRDSASSLDQRYDTLLMMHDGGPYTWEAAVPNGTYVVHVVMGDADYNNSVYKLNVEGVLTVDGTPTGSNRWIEGTQTVTVSDGKLTISNASGSDNNKIDFVEITSASPPAFGVKVNFQPAASSVPTGYLADSGSVYGDRGNGYTYGWDSGSAQTRDRDSASSADQRYDTFLMMHDGGPYTWELAVPNGSYTVHVVMGDADYNNSVYKLNVEGVLTVDSTPTGSNRWIEGTQTVTVSDGKLTVSNATGSSNNKICFIEVTQN